MESSIFVLIWCFGALISNILGSTLVCSECGHGKGDYLTEFCQNRNRTGGLTRTGSCCVNTTAPGTQVIGLDWSSCGLKSVSGKLNPLESLQALFLEDNPALVVSDADFTGLTMLQNLTLPENIPCPGGNSSWEAIEINKENKMILCQHELNLCNTSISNITCPNNSSHCVLLGPGQLDCLCNDGYHGYKCLRKGTFPTVTFLIGLCASTLALSVFLWCTQRRKVKVHIH